MRVIKRRLPRTPEALRSLFWRQAEKGVICPTCDRYAKIYRRGINSTMARALITLWRHDARPEFTHGPSLPGDTHELSQFAWWGLVEEERVRRPDGGRAGYWRLTEEGEDFVRERLRVPSHTVIYNKEPLKLEGDLVGIRDCLGKKFDLRELMRG